ncbi:MAG: hypothetical protein HY460_01520, partial [Parcubacteria group bacterium]|nr:hypothetical protein [Parcubacteria group bacterium]
RIIAVLYLLSIRELIAIGIGIERITSDRYLSGVRNLIIVIINSKRVWRYKVTSFI